MTDVSTTTQSSARRRSRTPRKPKKNMLPHATVLGIIMIAFAVYLITKDSHLSLFWVTGACFGFILQRSRFCFTASMRDPYLTGSTTITRAVLIAFAITTIGFTAIKYGYFINGLPIPGQSYVAPISGATAIGAVMFGIGMVIAGGCASGTLMRVGEGFIMNILSLAFFVIGSLLGAYHFGWWKLNFMLKGTEVFLPDVFGWLGGLLINLLIIATLYILADKWENREKSA
ncbi:MAG: YeeE/YedE family protein [Clostridia bacterium]|nr:YeeE/YedE family protein [Clostridia bacterium]